jgi:hypothetical protein
MRNSKVIAAAHATVASLETELLKAGNLRCLLYEQGKPLEGAIIESLRLMGFDAHPFANAESEFDSVFISGEGRFLGEAEGKDNKPVNVDKLSQLERNIQEDFARDEVESYAKGVLFGNAYRLTPTEDRGEFFTEKCMAGAKRAKIALVKSPDLFGPARYLKQNPTDGEYARECRRSIFRADGELVIFPPVPTVERLTSAPQEREG